MAISSEHQTSKQLAPFATDASIALVGMPGVGKSTLALITAKTLGYRFVDTDRLIESALGMAPFLFMKQYSIQEYRQREYTIISEMLGKSDNHCIISCGSAIHEYPPTHDLMVQFSKLHPVIHILCDEDRIVQYLRAADVETVHRLCLERHASYRECSNFEFFNLTAPRRQGDLKVDGPSRFFLFLKNTEADFIRFLKTVALRKHDENTIRLIPPEYGRFSYSITLKFPMQSLLQDANEDASHVTFADMVLGADCIEVVVDAIAIRDRKLQTGAIAKFVASIRRSAPRPIMYTVSMGSQNLDSHENRELYFELLDYGIRIGASYLNVDLTLFFYRVLEADGSVSYQKKSYISELISLLNASPLLMTNVFTLASTTEIAFCQKVIGTWYNDSSSEIRSAASWWDGPDPQEIIDGALMFCKVIRLSIKAVALEDNYAALSFSHRWTQYVQDRGSVLCVYNLGPLGRLSKILNPILSPVVASYRAQSFSLDRISEYVDTSIPTRDVSAYEAQRALHDLGILPKLSFYMFGGPLSTISLSPYLSNVAFRALGLPHVHSVYESLNPDELVQLTKREDIGGISIFSPYKEHAAKLSDTISDHARIIGSVNTIVPIRESRSLKVTGMHGENTDWIGLYNSILMHLSPVNSVSKKTTALIIGAGGSARAAIYSCIRLGIENIFLYNRTLSKAESIARYFNQQSPLSLAPVTSMPSSQTSTEKQFTSTIPSRVHEIKEVQTMISSDIIVRPRKFTVHVVSSLESVSSVSDLGFELPTVIVSAIPAHASFPLSWFSHHTGGVFLELYYGSLTSIMSSKMRSLQQRGWIHVNGLKVLPEMAASQLELWLKRAAPRSVMAESLLRYWEEHS
ncbi:uncharacterized protein V1516DRAFT_635153 [Lipomyces oligophaga]|uniref:uncharacterized protein n=1 Tax=Lipomyces oligophaga TaxID=45792 RepID=UPI0034CE96E5